MTQFSKDALVLRASQWCYQGVWAILTQWFMVPREPPTLPVLPGETFQVFRPSMGFLNYQRFFFWIGLVVVDLVLTVVWILIALVSPLIGFLITPLALTLIILPDIIVYIAIHLRYDTTWYLLTSRSMRIRRGIWIIHETTITFENIQNVHLRQGPVQRIFGFANLIVETAGGGSGGGEGSSHHPHQGFLEGLDRAEQVRDMIMQQVKKTRRVGLGDDREDHAPAPPSFSPESIRVLEEIYSLTKQLA